MDALGIIAIVLAVIGIAGGFLPILPGVFTKVSGGYTAAAKGAIIYGLYVQINIKKTMRTTSSVQFLLGDAHLINITNIMQKPENQNSPIRIKFCPAMTTLGASNMTASLLNLYQFHIENKGGASWNSGEGMITITHL